MPAHSGKRPYEMTTKKWGGRVGSHRRDDRRPPMHTRNPGSRHPVSPWANGMTPGMSPNVYSQNNFGPQPVSNNFLVSAGGMNRMGGGFDDQRGRGLLPPPSNTPLLGVAPPAFPPPARGPEFLQQRMGSPWDSSIRTGGPRVMSSGYYPSNRGRPDNSRKFLKARRPLAKTPSSKGSGPKEMKGKSRGTTGPKSPSSRGDGDKERASSHSKDLKNKQGDTSPSKSERSKDAKREEGSEDLEMKDEEVVEGEGKEDLKDDKEDGKSDQKQEDPFPANCLYCHICDLDSFSSKKGFIRHLQGITHAKMAELFHAKNAATLELLNISAKLAEMRQRDKVLRRTGKKGQPVMKTTEQILVQKWLKVGSCCGTKYKSPFGMEEHKLSIHHLKAKYMQKQKQVEDQKPKDIEAGEDEEESAKKEEVTTLEDNREPPPEEEVSADEVVRVSILLEKAAKDAGQKAMTMHTLPVYNPSIMIGLEFIRKELRFRCRVCKGQMFKSLDNHCQSHAHYDNIATYLNKIEDAKREQQRKEEEAMKDKKRAQEEAEKKEAKKKKKESEFVVMDEVSEDPKGSSESKEERSRSPIIADDDDDVIPLGEEEERILNAVDDDEEKGEDKEEEEEEEEEEEDAELVKDIFEEVGEKIDFDTDMSTQLENGGDAAPHEDDATPADEDNLKVPPPKKPTYTTRRRSRGGRHTVVRGRSAK